jgi:hypothetical protein
MKYYLRCENCGFYNGVNSEYLTFCESCKKKLSGNFREWQKIHPDKGLVDFKLEECIEESLIPARDDIAEPEEIKGKKLWLKVLISALLIFILMLLIFPSIYKDSQLLLYFSSLNNKEIHLDWEQKQYGDYGLYFDSPVKLEPLDLNIPVQHASLLEELQSFSSDPEASIAVMAISTEFNPSIGSVNLQASISSFIKQIKRLPGISKLRLSQKETSISGIEGYEQKGSFLQDGNPKAFISIGVTKGMILWQVMVVYDSEDSRLEEAKERIINSIEILYTRAT